jgi:hypothetical protein
MGRFFGRFHACLLVCVLSCTGFPDARAESPPTDPDGFTRFVAGAFQAALPGGKVTVLAPLRLNVEAAGRGEHMAYLDNIYSFCERTPSDCAASVALHVAQMSEAYKSESRPVDRAALRAVVRTTGYVDQLRAALKGRGEPVAKPLIAGLWVVCVEDQPTTMRSLSPADLKALGLTVDQAIELGKANVAAELPPIGGREFHYRAGKISALTGSPYEASYLLFPGEWSKIAKRMKGAPLLVSAPAGDLVLFTKETGPKSAIALAFLNNQASGRAERPLSNAVFTWSPEGWKVTVPENQIRANGQPGSESGRH